MAYLHNDVYDNGLSELAAATHLYLCSQEPTTYAGASSTYALGSKAGPTVGSPGARTPSGRKVTISATTGGAASANGTATHWALTDNTGSRLLAAGALGSSQVLTSGNPFTTTAFDIGIPAPA